MLYKMRHSIIRFSERGNPRRYTFQLDDSPTSIIEQHLLSNLHNRHISVNPSSRHGRPPNLLDVLTNLLEAEPSESVAVDTIPVYTADGDLDECSICQDKIKKGDVFRRLPCSVTVNHCFHKDCIDPWLKTNTTCPNCRSNLKQ